MMYRYLALLGIVLTAGVARAEDWPRFRGPDNNGISKEKGLLQAWPAGDPKSSGPRSSATGFRAWP